MVALRIFHTARPSLTGARVVPMDRIDEQFWKLRRERKAEREKEERR